MVLVVVGTGVLYWELSLSCADVVVIEVFGLELILGAKVHSSCASLYSLSLGDIFCRFVGLYKLIAT